MSSRSLSLSMSAFSRISRRRACSSANDRCSEAWLSKCFSPCFSLDDLLQGDQFDDSKLLQLSLEEDSDGFLFLSDSTDDFFGRAFRQGSLFSSLLFLKVFKFAERLNVDGVFFFLDFFHAGFTVNDPGTTLSCVTLLAGRIHFTNKDTFSEFLLIFQWYWCVSSLSNVLII